MLKIRFRGREAFHCPECRTDVNIPDNNVQKLSDAVSVHHKMELTRLKQRLDSGEMSCEECMKAHNNAGTDAFCTSCAQHVYKQCVHRHQTTQTTE